MTEAVHYVSYGTPGGEYGRVCRTALVTRTGAWRTTSTTDLPAADGLPRRRTVDQQWDPDTLALLVLNPAGLHFNDAVPHLPNPGPYPDSGGTWHRLKECPHDLHDEPS